MEPETEFLARARQMLAEEMQAAHDAIMATHQHAERAEYGTEKRTYWQLAIGMMATQAGAANALKRLCPDRGGLTFTDVRQGTPTRKKLKTNEPVQSVLNADPVEQADHAAAEISS